MLNLTYNEMLSAYNHYPAPIRPYLLRAQTHPVLRELLTKSFMRAFIDLLSRANIANPARPISVRMDVTAKRLGISVKTVSRTIAFMAEKSWLKPNEHHDGRNWQGKYAGREFILSDELRKLVGLPVHVAPPSPLGGPGTGTGGPIDATNVASSSEPAAPLSSAQVDSVGDSANGSEATEAPTLLVDKPMSAGTEMSDGSATYPQKQPENPGDQTEMSDGHIGVNNVFLKKEASVKNGAFVIENKGEKTIRIPADLADMHTVFGISGKGICGLMRLAKAKCLRLQDVWRAKKEQLAKVGATGGRAVLYLRRLLSCGEDFAYIARRMVSNPAAPMEPATADNNSKQPPHGCGEQLEPGDQRDLVEPRDYVNLWDFGKTCAFRKFRHISNGMIVRFYDGSADVSRGNAFEVYAGWDMMRGLYLGVYRGNLVEITE